MMSEFKIYIAPKTEVIVVGGKEGIMEPNVNIHYSKARPEDTYAKGRFFQNDENEIRGFAPFSEVQTMPRNVNLWED